MDDLTAFITARLGEDEAMAKAALAGPWSFTESTVFGTHIIDAGDLMVQLHVEGGRDAALSTSSHIARHDPARVLREVAAKRALLAWWLSDENEPESALSPSLREAYRAAQPGYVLIQALAAVYSDHPDYRAEWQPAR